MKTTKIKYKKKNLEVKFGVKEQIIFNKLTKRLFKGDTLEDNFYMFYSAVIVSLKKQPPMEEFIDFCDENPDALADYMTYLAEVFTEADKQTEN